MNLVADTVTNKFMRPVWGSRACLRPVGTRAPVPHLDLVLVAGTAPAYLGYRPSAALFGFTSIMNGSPDGI